MVRGSDRLRRALDRKRTEAPAQGAEVVRERCGDFGATLRERLRRGERRRGPQAPREPAVLPEGEVIGNERGQCYLVRREYPVSYRHGAIELSRASRLDGERLIAAGKDDALAAFEPGRALFLDTETTGLHGGAGNIVFMVGLGFFLEERFCVEQAFLRGFEDEPAALEHVAQRVWEYPHLVTFVGKTFDRHRLAARMAVQKVRSPMLTAPHLDLYYAARRRYKGELPDCKLRTIEERHLGLVRHDDLPGSEAPAAFFDWVRDRTGPVGRVFEHNHLDVLSLVTLLAALAGADA